MAWIYRHLQELGKMLRKKLRQHVMAGLVAKAWPLHVVRENRCFLLEGDGRDASFVRG